MTGSKSVWWSGALIMGVFVMAVWSVFGIHSEVLDEGYKSSWIRAVFTQNPIDDFFIFYIGLNRPLAFLYNFFAGIHWIYVLLQAQLLLSYMAFMAVFYPFLRNKGVSSALTISFCFVVMFVLLMPHLVIMTMSRVALLSSCLAMLSLLLFFSLRQKYSLSNFFFVALNVVLIVIAMGLRFEVVFVSVLLLGVFSVFFFSYFTVLLRSWWPIVVLLPIPVLYMQFDPHPDKDNFHRTEKLVIQQDDMYLNAFTKYSSFEDSMRMVALREWFFVDRKQIDERFIKEYTIPTAQVFLTTFKTRNEKFAAQLPGLKDFLANYYPLVTWHVLALLVVILLLWQRGSFAYRLLFFLFFFWLTMLAIGILVKFEHRHTAPWTSIGAIGAILIAVPALARLKSQNALITIVVIAGAISLFFTNRLLNKYVERKTVEEKYLADYREHLIEISKTNIVVLDLWAMINYTFTDNKTIVPRVPYPKILNYDSGYGTLYEPIRNEWRELTGGDDAGSFYRYLLTQKKVVRIISAPDRIKLMETYMRNLYGIKLDFEEISGNSWLKPTANNGRFIELKMYKLN